MAQRVKRLLAAQVLGSSPASGSLLGRQFSPSQYLPPTVLLILTLAVK